MGRRASRLLRSSAPLPPAAVLMDEGRSYYALSADPEQLPRAPWTDRAALRFQENVAREEYLRVRGSGPSAGDRALFLVGLGRASSQAPARTMDLHGDARVAF